MNAGRLCAIRRAPLREWGCLRYTAVLLFSLGEVMKQLPLFSAMRNLAKLVLGSMVLVVVGCSSILPEKRHSPAEIAAYTPQTFSSSLATSAGEQSQREADIAAMHAVFAQPVFAGPSANVSGALWNVGFLNTEKEGGQKLVLTALDYMLQSMVDVSADTQRAVLSAAHTYYPMESATRVRALLPALSTPRQFAIAAYALLKAEDTVETRVFIGSTLNTNGIDWATEPRIEALRLRLNTDATEVLAKRPPLKDLFSAALKATYPVIYSLQRQDRTHVGLAVVRGSNGKFVRNADGQLFNIPHLALALTNLPGTITNGNTPQGLFTIVGAGTATSKVIGPTPYLQSQIPIEAPVADFDHDLMQQKEEWTVARYESYLPLSWRTYAPFKEAYLAGRAGRNDMLIHGTTINADYYTGASFYPGTPSAGCLVAFETWDKSTGQGVKSDQLSLAQAFTKDGIARGYLIVVNLDDKLRAVALNDVLADIIAAESN